SQNRTHFLFQYHPPVLLSLLTNISTEQKSMRNIYTKPQFNANNSLNIRNFPFQLSNVEMNSLVSFLLLFIIFISSCHGKGEQSITEEESNKSAWMAIAARRRARYPHGRPAHLSNHTEMDVDSCSSYCRSMQGDGFCQQACNTPGCYGDLGDCHYLYHLPCDLRDCPKDSEECREECTIRGCSKGCMDREQALLAFLPSMHPRTLCHIFFSLEENLHNSTGFTLELAAVHSFDNTTYSVVSNYCENENASVKEEAMAVFVVRVGGRVTAADTEILDELKRLGTNEYLAQITPLLLTKRQMQQLIAEGDFLHQRREEMRKTKERREETWRKKANTTRII
ncbi:hypothetical protein PMAYCL1PPCAC_28542, partial [Pristionchus mayeri]